MSTSISDAAIAAAIHHARQPVGDAYVPKAANLAQLLVQNAKGREDKTYLSYYDDDRQLHRRHSYAQMVEAVAQTAGFMSQAGVQKGDRVAFLIGNLDHTVVLYLATWTLGACVAPINATEDFDRKSFIAEKSGAKLLFCRTDYLSEGKQLANRHKLRLIAVRNTDDERIDDVPDIFPDLCTPTLRVDPATATFDGQDVEALMIYTSGTTGAPKGVLVDQKSIQVDAEGMAQWHNWQDTVVGMCVLPIHHVNGIVVTCCTPLYLGGTTVLNARFNTKTFWERIQNERVNYVSVVPTLLEYLISGEARGTATHAYKDLDTSCLQAIICGAGPLLVETALNFEKTFGVNLCHGYGLSETTCYNCHMPQDISTEARHTWYKDYGFPSIGIPLAYQDMAILDSNNQPVQEGERGQIGVRGECICMGYDKRPDANASSFQDGWFLTGDEGFYQRDAQGRPFFFITGRLKELIIRGGVNYAPLEIDEALNTHPAVQAALAFPFPNKFYGEEIAAYVVLNEGQSVTDEELLAHCRATLAFSKSPKVVFFGTDIPYTSTGKPQRIQLAQKLAEQCAPYRDKQFQKA